MKLVYKDQQSYQEIGLLAVSKVVPGKASLLLGNTKIQTS